MDYLLWEWKIKLSLFMLPFVCTYNTDSLPPLPPSYQILIVHSCSQLIRKQISILFVQLVFYRLLMDLDFYVNNCWLFLFYINYDYWVTYSTPNFQYKQTPSLNKVKTWVFLSVHFCLDRVLFGTLHPPSLFRLLSIPAPCLLSWNCVYPHPGKPFLLFNG